MPNELLCFDLPAGAVAVYIYLLRHADRRTNQCYPSEVTMAKSLHLAPDPGNTGESIPASRRILPTLWPAMWNL